jgi:hypothetical protein
VAAYAVGAVSRARAIRLNSKATRVVVAFVVLGLIAGLAFLAGKGQGSRTTVLTGVAYVGQNEASVEVAGWWYGISGTGNLTWFDRQGTTHDSGWPSCLRGVGRHARITFGAVPVTGPDGSSWRQVVWVDCRG